MGHVGTAAQWSAACVLITAPDSKRSKARLSPFSATRNGNTTLSGSAAGVVWSATDDNKLVVVAAASAFRPFLQGGSGSTQQLAPDARIQVRVAGQTLAGHVVCMRRVPAIAVAAQQLLSARVAGGAGEFKWSVTPAEAPPADISQIMLVSCELPAGIESKRRNAAPPRSQPLQQGAAIHTIGNPFGATAPNHFVGLRSIGIVSQTIQENGKPPALLLADFRVLPGMEGAPTFDGSGALAGVLAAPFCIKGYELPVVVPITALAPAVSSSLRRAQLAAPSISQQAVRSTAPAAPQPGGRPMPSLSELRGQQQQQQQQQATEARPDAHAGSLQQDSKALRSSALGVVGCSLGNGQWASGVLVNRQGMVWTNAHLFDEPSPSAASGSGALVHVIVHSESGWRRHAATVLHIFSGVLDIAVIQISRPPTNLQPVPLSTAAPRPGASCFVAGHALFNPSGGLRPLLTRGNVAQVLELPDGQTGSQLAAMLLTTAAVHSGASGGAVLDDQGRLLGLVTSNARHASGRTIPHLNFSIAAAWLRPLWRHLQHQQDAQSLLAFDVADEQLLNLWTLRPFKMQHEPGRAAAHSKL